MNLEQYEKIRHEVEKVCPGHVETAIDVKDKVTLLQVNVVVCGKGVGLTMGVNEAADASMRELLGAKLWAAWVEAAMVAIGRDQVLRAISMDLDRIMLKEFERRENGQNA